MLEASTRIGIRPFFPADKHEFLSLRFYAPLGNVNNDVIAGPEDYNSKDSPSRYAWTARHASRTEPSGRVRKTLACLVNMSTSHIRLLHTRMNISVVAYHTSTLDTGAGERQQSRVQG